MYKKSELTFKSLIVFGRYFKPYIDHSFCIVSKMMFMNKINIDGTINDDQAGYLKRHDLWSYIYYLYYHNNSSVEEFVQMKNKETGKASALLMYKVVQAVVQNQFIANDDIIPFDVNTLIYFINVITQKYGENLRNPVVDYLRNILSNKDAVESIRKFAIRTGVTSGNVVLVTDPKEVDNANIKVKFGNL